MVWLCKILCDGWDVSLDSNNRDESKIQICHGCEGWCEEKFDVEATFEMAELGGAILR